jgi:RNA polymerase sigma factor (sigma-70 family)
MTTPEAMRPVEVSDSDLVANSLRGDREAFGHIVVRYQALVCSLAYSATGSLTQSEDLAQETFVTAWKQLSALREPARLRPWLCGIARNLSRQAWRGQQMEPVHQAESLETLATMHAPEAHPLQQAISREEESILWRQLEGIPETYREPLILFYRQHQSTEQVALALELSADTVRQRLVRGRKLLHEQVLAFVEGALEKTSPDAAFTLQVLAALPTVAISAKATAASATIATGGAVAKTAVGTLGLFGGLFAMLGGAFVTAQAQADDTKSLRERKFVFPHCRDPDVGALGTLRRGLARLAISGFPLNLCPRRIAIRSRFFHPFPRNPHRPVPISPSAPNSDRGKHLRRSRMEIAKERNGPDGKFIGKEGRHACQ